MSVTADILLESPTGRRVLLVECKAVIHSSPKSAAHLRRNLLFHSAGTSAAFFMLATPSALYLWNEEAQPDELPLFSSDSKQVLREYLGPLVDRSGGPRGESIERAIASWLSDLAGQLRKPEATSQADQMLIASGLYEQMKDGVVRTGVDA